MKKKVGRKPLKPKDRSKVLGQCYLCCKDITKAMINNAKAIAIGKGKYRCRGRKCEKKIVEGLLKQTKVKRKVWVISPVTKVLPNKKKKSRAKLKQDMRREL